MSPLDRKTMILALAHGMKQEQIAEILNTSLSSVEKELRYMRNIHMAKNNAHLVAKLSNAFNKLRKKSLKNFE